MKSSWGNITRKDSLLYGKARKKYTRKHPPKSGWLKIKPLLREKAAIMKLTRLGYSINILSEFTGRSTSYIHKIVRTAIKRGIDHFVDKRKLPSKTRLLCASARRRTMMKFWARWELWILGEGDKPP